MNVRSAAYWICTGLLGAFMTTPPALCIRISTSAMLSVNGGAPCSDSCWWCAHTSHSKCGDEQVGISRSVAWPWRSSAAMLLPKAGWCRS